MTEEDATPEQVEDLIAEFEKTQRRATAAGRPDIVERAQANIDNLREKLAAFENSQLRLAEATEELQCAHEHLDEVRNTH